jgi:hypothetical protein
VLVDKGHLDQFRAWKKAGNFAAIRQTYEAEQAHDDHAHYLLRAFSDGQLADAIPN